MEYGSLIARTSTTGTPKTQATTPIPPAETPRYAGFWIRFAADILDSILLDTLTCVLMLMILGVVYWVKILFFSGSGVLETSFFDSISSFTLQIGLVTMRGALSIGYFSWATYRYGTTFGKKTFSIYVVCARDHSAISLKQSILRCFSYLISYAPFGAGFLMVLFNKKKQALHDLIAGTVSIITPLM